MRLMSRTRCFRAGSTAYLVLHRGGNSGGSLLASRFFVAIRWRRSTNILQLLLLLLVLWDYCDVSERSC